MPGESGDHVAPHVVVALTNGQGLNHNRQRMEELHAKGLQRNQETAIKTHVLVSRGCHNQGCQGIAWVTQATNNTLISATCQPPAGYTLITSVNKYYKTVKDSVTWQAARDACSSEGTILVELRTAEEYQAIRPIYGKIMFKFLYIHPV